MSEQNSRPPRDIIVMAPPAIGLRNDDEAAGAAGLTLFGFFSRFNQWTLIDSLFEGRFLEQVAPKSYRKTFKEQADDIRVLFQHGMDPQVGDKPIARHELLEERDEGAYHESPLFRGVPELLIEGLRAGVYGQSFRMQVMREEFVDEPEVSDHNPLGLPERTIKEIRLYEFGPVTFPAYKNTTAGLREARTGLLRDMCRRSPERAAEIVANTDIWIITPQDKQEPAPSVPDAAPRTSERSDAAPCTSEPERRDMGHSALAHPPERARSALHV